MLLLADQPLTRVEHNIDWLHAPPTWVLILVVLPVVAAVVAWIYRGERGDLKAWGRSILVTLRIALILALVAFLCEPILTEERVQTRNGQILVLVDDSYSMGIADPPVEEKQRAELETATGLTIGKGTRRIELVQAFLQNGQHRFLAKLEERGNVRVASCSDGTTTLLDLTRRTEDETGAPSPELPLIELRGKVSRLGDSIYEAANELRGETLSAVVLFSDGRDNGGVMRPEEAARRFESRGIPIYTVGVGNAAEPKDVRIFAMEIPEVVLEGDTVSVDFSLFSEGFAGERVTATLSLLDESGRDVERPASKQLVLEDSTQTRVEGAAGDGAAPNAGATGTSATGSSTTGSSTTGAVQSARIDFVPRSSGRFLARLKIDPLEGELFEENNIIEKAITVLSQKIKVLYVEGPPRYEYRYLKNALTLDPTMESQCLLLSADVNFVQESSAGVPPLRVFPGTREELFQYHLVMIGDVPPEHPLLPPDWMPWLKEFVDEIGGGVIFLAGRDMPQRYASTPLESLFPVELEEVAMSPLENASVAKEFYPRRTVEGREHPILQLTGDHEQDAMLWREVPGREHRSLPGFFWYCRTKQLKRGGVALLVNGDASENHIKYGPRPLMAFQFFGRGRSFISLVDGTWRWRKNVGNQHFYKFWGQAIRFASLGRLQGKTQRFSLSTDQREYTLGSTVRVLARLLDNEFKPVKETECSILHRTSSSPGEQQALTAVQVPARPAYFETSLDARELGEHTLVLEDRGQEVATSSYRVVVPQLEYEEPRMDEALMKQIAQLSRGAYHPLSEAHRLVDQIQVLEIPIPVSAEQHSLWDRPLFLLLFAGALTLEWILRKVFRLS